MRNQSQANGTKKLKSLLDEYSTMSELYEGKTSNKPNVELLIPLLEDFGRFLAQTVKLKTTQIRKFFDAVKHIHSELKQKEIEDIQVRQRIIRLKPALAYATGRQRKQLRDFSVILYKAMGMVKSKKDFDYFVEFMESIVAYHKFYGGKD